MGVDKGKNTQLYIFGRWGRSHRLREQGNLYLKYKREDSTKKKNIQTRFFF